jgi:hypothetical protein
MSSFRINKNNDSLPRILQVKDWLNQNRSTKKLCIYCGNNEIKDSKQYCSEECEKHDSVWQFNN